MRSDKPAWNYRRSRCANKTVYGGRDDIGRRQRRARNKKVGSDNKKELIK
jgi:hypothetical protein